LIDSMLLVYFLAFFVLILLQVPISFAMLASSLIYLITNGQSLVMFAQKAATSLADFNMLAIPGYIFVGSFMNEIGLTDRIFEFAKAWIGHFTGGLAHANVLGSMIFAGMSGSALADAGGLGSIEVKAMKDSGYDPNFAVACTAASSAIGPIIPPSINFVVWAFLSQCSTLAMFLGGFIPGILMGVLMMVWIVIAVKKLKVKCPVHPKASWRERMHYTWNALPALGGPAILIGGITSGVFTPTECAVVAAAYCVIVAIGYRKFSMEMLIKALKSTLSSSGMIMAMCATGLIFNWTIVTSGLISFIADYLLSMGSVYMVLLVLNVLMLIMGCFIGSMQILIMIAPLLMTIADAFGLSYIHIGVMAVFNVTLGIITPPMAPALFVTCKATGESFDKSLKYTVQFLIPLLGTLILITLVPEFILWLPRVMGAI
jgi:tripartite ATP-independent transporter DctM subunit